MRWRQLTSWFIFVVALMVGGLLLTSSHPEPALGAPSAQTAVPSPTLHIASLGGAPVGCTNQADGTCSLGVNAVVTVVTTAVLTPVPWSGTFTDHSATITTAATPQTLVNSNASRRALYLENPESTATIWFNFTTPAVVGSPSIELPPRASFLLTAGGFVSTQAVSVTSDTSGAAVTVKEGQ